MNTVGGNGVQPVIDFNQRRGRCALYYSPSIQMPKSIDNIRPKKDTTFGHNVTKPKQIFVNVMNMLLFKYSKKNVWLKHFNNFRRSTWGAIKAQISKFRLTIWIKWMTIILLFSEGKCWYLSKEKWFIRYGCFSAVAVARQQTKGSPLSQSATCGCPSPAPSRSSFPPC